MWIYGIVKRIFKPLQHFFATVKLCIYRISNQSFKALTCQKMNWEYVISHTFRKSGSSDRKTIINKKFGVLGPIFFISYWAAPRSTLAHYREGSLTHPMLITVHIWFDLKATGRLITGLGLKAQPNAPTRFFRMLSIVCNVINKGTFI